MILEARSRQALDEVLVIASALSVQDVRDRPMEAQRGRPAHVKFDDEKSEFTGYLKLWKWIIDARGEKGQAEHRLSNRQYEQLLRQNFVNIRRVREWKDIHSQLHTVVAEHKWRLNTQPASYEQLHLSMLSGLLGNIGCKLDDDEAIPGRAWHQVLPPPRCAPEQEAGALDCGGRTGGDDAPVWPRHCRH